VGVPYFDHNVWNNTMKNNNGDKIWGSHSGVTDNSSLPGYDAVSLGRWFVMFQRIMAPSSLWVKKSKKNNQRQKCHNPLKCNKPLYLVTQHYMPQDLNP
jgi:hypothetical protein